MAAQGLAAKGFPVGSPFVYVSVVRMRSVAPLHCSIGNCTLDCEPACPRYRGIATCIPLDAVP